MYRYQKISMYFAVTLLSITSIFASLIIGIIRGGKEKVGYKYIPILLVCSLAIFFLVRYVLTNVFGHLLHV